MDPEGRLAQQGQDKEVGPPRLPPDLPRKQRKGKRCLDWWKGIQLQKQTGQSLDLCSYQLYNPRDVCSLSKPWFPHLSSWGINISHLSRRQDRDEKCGLWS